MSSGYGFRTKTAGPNRGNGVLSTLTSLTAKSHAVCKAISTMGDLWKISCSVCQLRKQTHSQLLLGGYGVDKVDRTADPTLNKSGIFGIKLLSIVGQLG
jgi:hypothetical protein